MNRPPRKEPSRRQSIFQRMTSEQRRDFHSPEAQRQRNKDRAAAKEQGQVYDISLQWEQVNNQESISTATNDTFGNDEFTLANNSTVGGGYVEEAVILCRDGSPVEGFILFKED